MTTASLEAPTRLAQIGHWMRRNAAAIRGIQWTVVVFYAVLVVIPAFMPLPGRTSHIWNNLTIFAQFVFWGIWWPFVLVSIALLGRVWCGVICPEGTLSEFASKYGRGRAIPRWMRWGGWPFVAFSITTLYGQMVSVYQYPKAVLLVLGGSTVVAVGIGLLYGREKRIWCKYLCPVNGVFSLLSRLAPLHYKVDEEAWRRSYTTPNKRSVIPINCAPLVPLRHMKGNSECHMCGRCSDYRDSITLSGRPFGEEIVKLGRTQSNGWDTLLILYGLLGIAIGAFHWTASPWFITIKQTVAMWLAEREIMWPFETNAPWFLFTHYPEQNDVFSWLDGGLLITYILTTGLVYGTLLVASLSLASLCLGKWCKTRLNHLAQALIPLAACGVFIGLSATTLTILRAEHIDLSWANPVRFMLLAGASLWSAWLGWHVIRSYATSLSKQILAMFCVLAAVGIANSAWWLMFWHW